MTEKGYLIGVDGGGSKTLALASDLQGGVLGRGAGGPSNYHTSGIPAAYAALEAAVAAAITEASAASGDTLSMLPAAVCLGMAGVDRPEDLQVIHAWVEDRFPGIPCTITNDALLVLAAGTPENWGVSLICGTGSIAYGRDPGGRLTRAGGWGYLLGDEGSGYAIGLAALRAVACAADGRAPATLLTGAILGYWSLAHPQDLIARVYAPGLARAEIAALTVLVEDAASEGDAAAQAILDEAAQELARAASAVIHSLGLDGRVPCALAGSVLVKSSYVGAAFLRASRALGLDLDPVTPVPEPATGAIRLARDLLDA